MIAKNKIKKGSVVGVVGATGVVGRTLLKVLEERNFSVSELRLFASERSRGRQLSFNGSAVEVEKLDEKRFSGCDFIFFCAGGDISREYVPLAAKSGAIVIDKSSVFRMHENIPLVVPEVNPEDISEKPGSIIASPNCSTTPLVMVLKPFMKCASIERVIVSTYQSASGAGMKGLEEMIMQTRAYINEEKIPAPSVFAKNIVFNLIPQIDSFLKDGYTKEEKKMIDETRKILHLPDLRITATCVRVPVTISHSLSVTVDFNEPISPSKAKEILLHSPGIVLMDDPQSLLYPTPEDTREKDSVFVGRIRQDTSNPNGLNLWAVTDNLRKGAATNAVQIAEHICQ